MSHIRDVIHPRLKTCVGIFVAAREPCLGLNNAVPARGRTSHRATPATLQPSWFEGSFAVCVLLCPGDDTTCLLDFARAHSLEASRFHFYHVRDADVFQALAPWRAAGLAIHSLEEVASWGDVNQHFGNHWNAIAHDDLCPTEGCKRH